MAVRIARVSLLLVAAAAGLGRLSVALEGRGRARRALERDTGFVPRVPLEDYSGPSFLDS